jgi:CelD/BcsL family acetyltransferase involved in cellulose biosynthesis
LRLDVLREIPEDAILRREWDALALSVERPQVFYTYEWALAVYRAYGATLRPLVFLAYDEQNSLCGVAALVTDAGGGKRVSFLGATTGDYCDFLSPREQRALFLSAVFGELRNRGIEEVAFANLPADSPSVAALRRAARENHYRCFMRTAYMCTQVSLDSLERRGEGKPVLPRKKMLRRFLNAMGRENPVRLDHSRSASQVQAILPQFMQAHVARFLVTGRISNLARPERRLFLTELAKLLSEDGWVVLTRMMSGDRVFAWNYGFQFQGTWFWYQPTFGSDLEKYSPGFCLLAKVIEEAADNPALKIVDLGLGAEEYKERFANQTRKTLFVSLRASASAHYREIARYRASAMVKSSREVELAVRSAMLRLKRATKYFGQRGTAGILPRVASSLRNLLWAKTEVLFYEWCGPVYPQTGKLQIRPLALDHLAIAAMQYVDDEETLAYLLRSARRLTAEQGEGFVLVDHEGRPFHFAWHTRFDKFVLPELKATVEASPEDVLLFDSWTPAAMRGRGYYAQAIELIADTLKASGQRPWVFSPSANVAAVRGLAKAGFQKRYSLFCSRVLWWQNVTRHSPNWGELSAQEASART